MDSSERILVACIGNVFLGDDGFGVEIAERLAREDLPREAIVVDYGIRGLDLAYTLLEPWRAVILVDAISQGGEPGTVYVLEPEIEPTTGPSLDPHSMDPFSVFALARSLGEITAPVYVVGCEPRDFGDELEGRMGLSPAAQSAIPHAIEMVRQLVQHCVTQTLATTTTSSTEES